MIIFGTGFSEEQAVFVNIRFDQAKHVTVGAGQNLNGVGKFAEQKTTAFPSLMPVTSALHRISISVPIRHLIFTRSPTEYLGMSPLL